MPRDLITSLAALALCGACTNDVPAQPEPMLELTGRVVDAADIFEPEYEAELTQRLTKLEEGTLVQLVVVSTPDLKGYDIADYSLMLGNSWGIGDANRDDGLLLVVAPNERKVRIAVGLGLEDLVTNAEAGAIIESDILPAFRQGDFKTGVAAGVDALILEVTPVELKEAA